MKGIDLLSIDYWVNGEILAGASLNGDEGVYYTKDNGEHWQRVLSENLNTNAVAFGLKGFYVGTYSHNPFNQSIRLSTDNGTTWTESGLINCSISCFAFYQNPIMFAGIKQ
ncbi:MAG: exo-alpha-sialidase [Ignavibacteriae bacterium]|nr:exo-alpha-sialidase [Ignavibacteriota bacterium]